MPRASYVACEALISGYRRGLRGAVRRATRLGTASGASPCTIIYSLSIARLDAHSTHASCARCAPTVRESPAETRGPAPPDLNSPHLGRTGHSGTPARDAVPPLTITGASSEFQTQSR